jgi:Leucine-rich repeat (LRR) protein
MSAQYNDSENEETVYMNNISELNIDESYQNNVCESQTPNKNKDMNENKSKRNEKDFTNIEELRTSHSDLYTDTVEGVYDEINNKQYRYKDDSEQHIYSNSVDNVYDSASQAMYRTRDDDVDTYDHFIGHRSEND